MPRCPHCGKRLRTRQVLAGDLRNLSCEHCPAILSVQTRAGLLPAIVLMLLGPPVAVAVRDGWFSLATAVIGGLLLLIGLGWLGFALSRVQVVRLRPMPS